MFIFFAAFAGLLVGYLVYGLFVEKVIGLKTDYEVPSKAFEDGVDYVPMSPVRIFLIQFLNIAGLGPVFGAILGALYGPVCLLWIVFGSIFAGGVHDFLTGIMSMRHKGASAPVLMEEFFGKKFRYIFLILLTFLLLLVGSIFAQSPAHMMANLTGISFFNWLWVVFAYYLLATILPIDKVIGRVYPLFALCLLVSSVLLIVFLGMKGLPFYPNLTLSNLHPNHLPLFPLIFVTIACGAVSGFHATQSPLMARCVTDEKQARPVFYGAMILEGVVALIWATLGIAFYQGSEGLLQAVNHGGAIQVVEEVSRGLLGKWGGLLTVISVMILSITSGDTAFRSARLSCADVLHLNQKNLGKRVGLSLLILGSGAALSLLNLSKIWTYFGWSNQMVATFMLFCGVLFLKKRKRFYWVALVPALFMTSVCATYFAYSPLFLGLEIGKAKIFGVAVSALAFIFFVIKQRTVKVS
ncbi:MAG: carbon starvation CstA family protein [Alphaproteobacteria bacterium]|nr:carbon starvation CstA family protein [Alphaproteobacteria bacterium]